MEPLSILLGGILLATLNEVLNEKQKPVARKKLKSAPKRTGKIGGGSLACDKVAAPSPAPEGKPAKRADAPAPASTQAPGSRSPASTAPATWKDRPARPGDEVTVQKQVVVPGNTSVRVDTRESSTYSTIPAGTKGRILGEDKSTNELLVEFILHDGRPWRAWLKRNLLNGSVISF